MKAANTITKEARIIYRLWKEVRIGSARGWFLLGALWALAWVQSSKNRPAKFAEREWECDR